jgi:hypothetical protein
MPTQMIKNMMSSALTFRVGTREKISFIVLNWIDLSLTLFAMTIGANELNPVMRNLFSNPVYLCSAKMLIPIMLAWVLPGKVLLPSIVLLLLVVGWNIKELLLFYH